MSPKELAQQKDRVDQSLSAHTSLAERYRHRQQLTRLAILLLSILATALAFVGEDHDADLWLARASLPIWAGVLSAIIFALALVVLVTDWDERAAAHEGAAHQLSELKAIFRAAKVLDGDVDSGHVDLEAEYWRVMHSTPAIPNRQFVRLKAEHHRKVEQSKAINRAPTVPVWFLRLRLSWDGIKQLMAATSSEAPPVKDGKNFLADEDGNAEVDDSEESGWSQGRH